VGLKEDGGYLGRGAQYVLRCYKGKSGPIVGSGMGGDRQLVLEAPVWPTQGSWKRTSENEMPECVAKLA